MLGIERKKNYEGGQAENALAYS